MSLIERHSQGSDRRASRPGPRASGWVPIGAWLTCALLAPSAVAQQLVTSIASVSSSGVLGDSFSFSPSISDDGRFIAFSSVSMNLVPVDNNFSPDVFVHDRVSGQTVRASESSSGGQGNGISWFPAISGNGRFVAFPSLADSLVAGDTNSFIDVFVKDLQTGTTTRVSLSSGGAEADASLGFVAISTDGRFVAFDGDATNLVTGDTNMTSDVFVHDRQTAQTTRVSVGTGGIQGDGPSISASVSADGRFVVFTSGATNLVPADANQAQDVFLHDRTTGQTTRLSTDGGGNEGNGDSNVPSISDDGRFVVFESVATNLVPGDTNGQTDIFVRDLQSGTITILSVTSGGVLSNGLSSGAAISADGRFVTFFSSANNLVPGLTAGFIHLFLRDRQTGQTELWSVDPLGMEGNGNSFFSSISADGQVVAFESEATNLVAGDTNFAQDIYVRRRLGPPLTPFCPGDGSGTACPCGNPSAVGSGQGCLHSLGTGGLLQASGVASIAADSVVLTGTFMPNSSALYFQGTGTVAGGAGAVFGDGLRCVVGGVVRLATKTNVGGASQFPAAGDPLLSVRGMCVPGNFRTYQVWFRNAAAFCSVATFNLTNGVQFTWAP